MKMLIGYELKKPFNRLRRHYKKTKSQKSKKFECPKVPSTNALKELPEAPHAVVVAVADDAQAARGEAPNRQMPRVRILLLAARIGPGAVTI
jgi:hypothetical protein